MVADFNFVFQLSSLCTPRAEPINSRILRLRFAFSSPSIRRARVPGYGSLWIVDKVTELNSNDSSCACQGKVCY